MFGLQTYAEQNGAMGIHLYQMETRYNNVVYFSYILLGISWFYYSGKMKIIVDEYQGHRWFLMVFIMDKRRLSIFLAMIITESFLYPIIGVLGLELARDGSL